MQGQPPNPGSNVHKPQSIDRTDHLLNHCVSEVKNIFDQFAHLCFYDRFDGALNVDLNEFQTNLVCYAIGKKKYILNGENTISYQR